MAAIRAAQHLQKEAADLGIRVRGGAHIGEVLERNGSLRGIAVHLAARVLAAAAGGEVLVSETVRESSRAQASASTTAVSTASEA